MSLKRYLPLTYIERIKYIYNSSTDISNSGIKRYLEINYFYCYSNKYV